MSEKGPFFLKRTDSVAVECMLRFDIPSDLHRIVSSGEMMI